MPLPLMPPSAFFVWLIPVCLVSFLLWGGFSNPVYVSVIAMIVISDLFPLSILDPLRAEAGPIYPSA